MLVLLLPRLGFISNPEDSLASLLTFLLLFLPNEMFDMIPLFQWLVAWEGCAGVSTSTDVCLELERIVAFMNACVICALASALKRSVQSTAIKF